MVPDLDLQQRDLEVPASPVGAVAPSVTGVLAVVVPLERNVPNPKSSAAQYWFWLNVVLLPP